MAIITHTTCLSDDAANRVYEIKIESLANIIIIIRRSWIDNSICFNVDTQVIC